MVCLISYVLYADHQGFSDAVSRDPRLDCRVPTKQPRDDSDNGWQEHAHWAGRCKNGLTILLDICIIVTEFLH